MKAQIWLDQWEDGKRQDMTVTDITAAVRELCGFVKMARDELGVPSDDYPAPVANAAQYLDEALKRVPAALRGKP